jgi:hypothetical protein
VSRLREAPDPAEAAVTARPIPIAAPGAAAAVLALQRSAGNQATVRALMRADESVSVTGVKLSEDRASIPSDGPIQTIVEPANATGVTFKLEKDTVEPAGSSVDEKGVVTVGETQEGGTILVRATGDNGSTQSYKLMVAEKPTTLTATTIGHGSDPTMYATTFVHTFTGKSNDPTRLEGANFNERFDSPSVPTPFEGPYEPRVNPINADGWFLNASGAMTAPDNLGIKKSIIDVRKFIKSASNPSPEAKLPQTFTFSQRLHARTFPSKKLHAEPFTTVEHVRTLEEKNFTVYLTTKAGLGEVPLGYEGPPAYQGIVAEPAKVEASPPKPAEPSKVSVMAEVLPLSAERKYSIVGDALGCEIDEYGEVLIGSTPGKITVRVSDGAKEPGHYDEVVIEITPPPAAPAE